MTKRRMIASSLKFLVVVLAAVGIVCPALADEVKVGAGAAPVENVFNKIKEPMAKDIGVNLTIISNGPSQALKDLDAGSVDAAAAGMTFADWMAMMTKAGYAIPDRGAYKSRVIGKDLVKVLTNKDVSVKNLSQAQLADIFTGKAKNWSEVGGPDQPIVVLLGSKIPGTQAVFQKQVMAGAPYATGAVEGTTADDLKTKVAATPGGVCLGPMSGVDASVNAPEVPEIGRPITIITKGEPSGAVLKMLDYIRGQGQQYIVK